MGFSVSLFVTILWVQGFAEIRVPGQDVDKNTLTTLGIKTLDWQGGDPSNSTQVQMHHNYSKVYTQNENLGQQAQVDEFGQAAASDEFSPQTSFGGQEQDVLNLDDFSQFSDGDDNAFQLQVSSQQNQGRDLNSLVVKATFEGQKTDDVSGVSKNLQTNGGIPQYQTSQDYFSNQYSKSFGQQEELVTRASSHRSIYNAHSYGNLQRLDEIMEAEKSQQFEEFPEYDQLAEATSNEAQVRQVKKFYTLDKSIYVHGFKYPPDPENPLNGNVAVPESEVHTKCPKMVTGQFVYALSCNQFLNCWKGRGHVQNCAPGTLFNPQTLECDFASKVKCLTGPRKPELEQERNLGTLKLKTGCPAGFSGIVPHHNDCSKFINCANGVENVMDCPPGTLFSLKINSCDFPYKAECASWSVEFGGINSYGKYGNGNAGINQQQQYSYYQSGSNGYNQYEQSLTNFGKGYGSNSHIGTQQYLQESVNTNKNHYGDQSQQTGSYGSRDLNQGLHATIDQQQGVDVGQHQQSNYYTGSASTYGQKQDTFTGGSGGTHNSFGQVQGNIQDYNQYGGTSQSQIASIGNQGSVNCPVGTTGLLPHPHDCSKFLDCTHGRTTVRKCASGTVFNPNINTCIVSYRYICPMFHAPHKQEQHVSSSSNGNFGQNDLTRSQSQYLHGQQHIQGHSQNQGYYTQYPETTASGGVTTPKQDAVKCPGDTLGLIPHPYDCSKFLNCAHGQTSVENCGPGTVFNPVSKVCDFPHNVDCSSSKSSINEGTLSHGQYVQAQGSGANAAQWETSQSGSGQGKYYGQSQISGQSSSNQQKSSNNGGTLSHGQYVQGQGSLQGYGANAAQWETSQSGSGQGKHYGQSQISGQSSSNQQKSNAIVKCPEYASGLYPHPTICSKFLNCANGQTFIQDCGPGTVFNPTSKVCDFPYNVECVVSHGEGLINIKQVPVSPTPEQTIPSGNEQGFQGQNHHGSGSNSQQGPYGQGQGVGWGKGQNTGHESSGTTQQEYYGQGQATGLNIGSQTHGFYEQGHNFLPNSNQQGSYDQSNSNSGGYQQGLYDHTQSTGSSSASKNQQEEGYQQGLYGQTQSTGSSSVSNNQHQGFQGQSQQGQVNNHDQQFDETRNYNQIYGTSTRYNQEVSGSLKPHHTSSPFPSTDLNADYEFGSEDGSPRLGTFKPVMVKPKPKDNRKRKDFCEPLDFHCSVDDCIPLSMVCDGIKDCANSADEQSCDKYLQVFTSVPNSILAVREKDKFLNISLIYCAKNCIESKSFECKSFSYRKDDGACFLSDTNVGYSGALVFSHPYNYYELKASSVNCTGLYKCPSQKCIQHKQLCDGINDCGDRIDEKGCDAKTFGYEIKLGGTDKKHEGRIELKAFGKWGFICDDKFGLRDADVVCKELGFPLGALEVKGNSHYAQDVDDKDVFYLMDDVTCLGNETTVRDCDFNGWGVHNCEVQEIVGVICKTPQETCPKDYWKCDSVQECLPIAFVCDGVFDCTDQSDEGSQHCEAPTELRLAGGSSKYEGRVEIRHHGIWGTVCDDDFNDDAAKVVCKHLGFPGKATAKKDGYFGPGSGPIWLDQVFCQGNESDLQYCVHWNWGEHNCEHGEDVGVVCSNNKDDLDVGSERHVQIHQRKNVDDILPEYLFPERCGLRKDDIFLEEDDVHFRVVKGSIARKGDYPWQASLRIKNKSKPAHWCGAVVISQKFVLTAAHCLIGFSKGAYFVVAGDYNTDDVEGTEQEAYIDEFYIHDQFRAGQKMNNDIALVKLKGDGFVFTKDVQPICLPEADVEYKNGLNCTISGFGTIQSGVSAYSHQMRAGWIPLQSRAVCQMPHVYGTAITDGMICAGSLDEGVDACDGDSGGPLACLHEGFFTLFGLTSWGQHCGHANKPGVYVKVAYYRKWIDDTIRKNS